MDRRGRGCGAGDSKIRRRVLDCRRVFAVDHEQIKHSRAGWYRNKRATLGVARAIYQRWPEGAPLWMGKEFEPRRPRGWKTRYSGNPCGCYTAAVTALLDRLLHHAHVLKCGPRSWRTRIQTDLRTDVTAK